MKRLLLLSLITAIIFTKTYGQTPVAYYPFTGNANDAVGSNNGTVIGATLSTDRLGNSNSAYNFNGTGNHVNLGSSNTLRPTAAITVSAWFTLSNLAGSVNGRNIVSCTEASGYNIGYDKALNKLVFYLYRNSSFADPQVDVGGYENTGWHHIAGTYDGRYTSLYIDGVLKATNDAGSNHPIGYGYPFGNVNTYIGTEAGAGFTLDPNYYWQGKIDEVKIYNTALTSAQIKEEAGVKPGSGNAISFDGVDDYVEAPGQSYLNFGVNQDFVVETWVKIPANQTAGSIDKIIIDKWGGFGTGNAYPFSIRYIDDPGVNNGKIVAVRSNDIGGGVDIFSLNAINDNKWHHIALAKNGTTLSLYVDGVLNGSATDLSAGSTANTASLTIGKRNGGSFPAILTAGIDEVRIWNTGMTQTQIRERMCRKITSTDALYTNLVAYYNFDETTGSTAIDASANSSGATLTNNPARLTSGAPIGNTSSFDYNATPSALLTYTSGETFSATATAGSPTGIHVYSVNEKPNNTTGALGAGDNDRYFGVFVAGGTAPQYTAIYNYTGNPLVTAGNEPLLILNKRDNNAAALWSNSSAALNTTANTLTATGQNTEYMLGLSSGTLPVMLTQFTAVKQLQNVLLQWQTATEQNNAGFYVQHCTDGIQFNTIGFVNGARNSSSIKNYNFIHRQPVKGKNYYRLLQKDADGRSTASNIKLVVFNDDVTISLYPNPVNDVLNIQLPLKAAQITLLDAAGKVLWQRTQIAAGNYSIPLQHYAAGIILLHVADEAGNTTNYKIIKQ
jgi:hypothetical protein